MRLLNYPLFVRSRTPLAIGNETDMFHPKNVDYLIELLMEIESAGIDNSLILITKAPISAKSLERIRLIGAQVVFFLSYSGLGKQYEPNFSDQKLRANFSTVKSQGFPIIHYWRPLLPQNTTSEAIRRMLLFVSEVADATVFVGLKLHPELTPILTRDGVIDVPQDMREKHGEWLPAETISVIYQEALQICPSYPLYRHASCALAKVLKRPNHTATVYREDVCPPSHCPPMQRKVCQAARRIPSADEIVKVGAVLGRFLDFECRVDRVIIREDVTQEEFAFLLHSLNCPLEVNGIQMSNIYRGDIFTGMRTLY